jgi:hypothetical protein
MRDVASSSCSSSSQTFQRIYCAHRETQASYKHLLLTLLVLQSPYSHRTFLPNARCRSDSTASHHTSRKELFTFQNTCQGVSSLWQALEVARDRHPIPPYYGTGFANSAIPSTEALVLLTALPPPISPPILLTALLPSMRHWFC